MKRIVTLFFILFPGFFLLSKEEAEKVFSKVGSEYIFSDLKQGDSRKNVMSKLRSRGFLQIYEERDRGLVKCTLKLNGFRYQLAAKLKNDKLKFCLIEGQKGWQSSFYFDVVEPQWTNMREILVKTYGGKRKHRSFPQLNDIPFNDEGGYVTDTWDLNDRLVMLTVLLFEVKDCCTNQMVEYSSCTLLIQPKG